MTLNFTFIFYEYKISFFSITPYNHTKLNKPSYSLPRRFPFKDPGSATIYRNLGRRRDPKCLRKKFGVDGEEYGGTSISPNPRNEREVLQSIRVVPKSLSGSQLVHPLDEQKSHQTGSVTTQLQKWQSDSVHRRVLSKFVWPVSDTISPYLRVVLTSRHRN